MKTLYLHIGHGKTGSSYIQSSLAASVNELRRNGIAYPLTPQMREAALGTVSSGNGPLLKLALNGEAHHLPQGDKVLFSSEEFFHRLGNGDFQGLFRSMLEKHRFDRISVLLFIRDPVAHACSSYQQMVKLLGYHEDIRSFLRMYNVPRRANMVLDFLETLPCELTIKNYSNSRDVLAVVESWLSTTLKKPQNESVNRSLNGAELAFQRAFNRICGKDARVLSKRLCDELPNIPAEHVRPPVRLQKELWNRLRPDIDLVNVRVHSDEHYQEERDIKAEQKAANLSLTEAQIALITEILATSR